MKKIKLLENNISNYRADEEKKHILKELRKERKSWIRKDGSKPVEFEEGYVAGLEVAIAIIESKQNKNWRKILNGTNEHD